MIHHQSLSDNFILAVGYVLIGNQLRYVDYGRAILRFAILSDVRICEQQRSKIKKDIFKLIPTGGGISPVTADDIVEMNFVRN